MALPCYCCGKGDFLFLSRAELVILTKKARTTARGRACGERHSLCSFCGFVRGIISFALVEHLARVDFTHPTPLTIQQARQWTPEPGAT
jgi:hypothetical protein